MNNIWIYLFSVLMYFQSPKANAQTLQNAKDVYNQIFNGYIKSLTPNNDFSKPFEIAMEFYLLSIDEFKETEQTLVLNGAFLMNWTDSSLQWNPSSFGNLEFLQVDSKDVWVPWMYLSNNAEELEPVGSDSEFKANILSDGSVGYSPGGIFKAKCATDISKFPFDKQSCTLNFLTWSSDSSMFKFSSNKKSILLDYYTTNADWDIIENSALVNRLDGYEKYNVHLTIKRASTYYALMVVIPTTLLCLLNPIVFLLPSESGERVGFSMTILLSYAIFLTLVSSSIPATSNPMSYLLCLMVGIMIISGIIVFLVILSGTYYHKNEYQPGKMMRFFIKIIKRKVGDGDNSEKSAHIFSGQDVSKIFDKVFMIVAYILIILFLFIYFIYISV